MSVYRNVAVAGLFALSLLAQAPAQPAGGAQREPGLYANIQTTEGLIVAKLYESETPVTVKNFVDLQLGRKSWMDPKTGQRVRKPLYNGVLFHRVIPDFMIQTGDPSGTGAGNVGFTIKDEFVPTLRFDKPGILGMANIGQPNTGGSQFFITTVPTPHLNNQHTVFGYVVEGMDVVNAIGKTKTGADDKPVKPIRITTIKFERAGAPPANDILAGPPAAKKAAPAKKAPAKKK